MTATQTLKVKFDKVREQAIQEAKNYHDTYKDEEDYIKHRRLRCYLLTTYYKDCISPKDADDIVASIIV